MKKNLKHLLLALLMTTCATAATGFLTSCDPASDSESTQSSSEVLTVTLDKTEVPLTVGGSVTLKATVSEEGKTVTWTTSNAAVATVENGVVTAVAEGSATITATVDGESATCTVTVTDNSVKTIDLGVDSPLNIVFGSSYQLEPRFLVDGVEVTEGVDWSYVPDNEFHFNVDTNGNVTTGNGQVGTADLFISALYKGKTYDETLRINVINDVAFSVTPETANLSAAANGENPTTTQLSYSLTVNGSAVTEGVTWRSENEAIATVAADGTVTARKEGEVKIYAETEDGDYAYATITVSAVDKASGDYLFTVGGEFNFVGEFGTITGIVDENGNALTYTLEDDGFTLSGISASGAYTAIVKNGVYNQKVTFAIADTVINTLEDFRNWQANAVETKAGNKTYDGYVALGADIDGNNEAFNGWGAGSYWAGTFDGRGHTISNVRVTSNTSSMFAEFLGGGTIKNLAVTGVSLEAAFIGTLTVRAHASSGGVIENCFVSGTMNGTNYQGLLFSYSDCVNLKVNNCVTFVENGVVAAKNAGLFHGYETAQPVVTNTVVLGTDKAVVLASSGANYTENFEGITTVTTLEQLENVDLSAFEGVAVAPNVKASEQVILADSSFTLSGTLLNTYALKAAVDGITLEGNTVTVAAGTDGTKFTVVATSITGVTQELTFEVVELELIDLTATKNVDVDLSKTSTTVDVSALDGTVTAIWFGEKAVAYTPADNAITVENAQFGTDYGVKTVEIYTDANKIYKISVTVATYVISDLAGLNEWQSKHADTDNVANTTTYTGYVVMAADIDAKGATYGGTWVGNSWFGGTFDGRGYTISNITFNNFGLVGDYLSGTVKNVGLQNVTVSGSIGGVGAVCNRPWNNGLIENVYVSGKVDGENNLNGLIMAYNSRVDSATCTIRNCVVVALKEFVGCQAAFISAYYTATISPVDCTPVIENCILIGSEIGVRVWDGTQSGKVAGDNITASFDGITTVTSVEEFEDLDLSGFTGYWNVEGKFPVYAGVSFAPNAQASVSVVTQDSTFTLSGNVMNTYALKEAVEGITLEGNTVTVAAGTIGVKFTVVATSITGATQELAFEVAAPEEIDLTAMVNVDVDLSKTSTSVDASELEGTVTAIRMGDKVLVHTYADNIITVENAQFGADYGVKTVEIYTNANKIYKISATVASYVISDLAGLNEWQTKQTATAEKTYTGYVVLAADIDAAGAAYGGTWIGNTYFTGTFDGRGYSISNIVFSGASLVGDYLAGTVKNLALKNVTVGGVGFGAVCIRPWSGGVIENVFVSGKCTEELNGLIMAYNSAAVRAAECTIKNCVVVAQQEFSGRQGAFISAYSTPSAAECTPNIENCVLIGSEIGVAVWDASTNKVNGHITADEDIDVYATDAAWTAGAATSVTSLGSAWSYDAETQTLKLLGNTVYTVTAA